MASTAPAKSQPLHNFTLPHHLKWNKDGQPGGHQQRRRSTKSPSRRPNTSSPSPLRQSPLRESVSASMMRHQSPLSDSTAPPSPVRRDYYLGKHSSVHGESSDPFLVREWAKRSPIGDDPPPPHIRRHDSPSSKGKGESADFQRIIHSKNGVSSPNPEQLSQKLEMKSKAKEVDSTVIKKSKILIKIPCKNNKIEEDNRPEEAPAPKIDSKIEAAGETNNNHNYTEEETKIWNLRPRKPISKPMSANNGVTMKNKSPSPLTNQSNNKSGGSGEQKKEKKKLSVFLSLSKEEIEEDIFSLTGSKPARRPKKRPKFIQKQVDSLFPGSWLVSINADSYKVSENSLKG
ncbi:hypothetical protein CASFOL_041200 [Castilleja foliolosa]|uniref:Uncharacterized protein n=1 Tax=Castilleja foliolosa TaxID=1961234 RepID=A0ABD3BE56_9LAMI